MQESISDIGIMNGVGLWPIREAGRAEQTHEIGELQYAVG